MALGIRLINIVSNLERVNFGVWNAAIQTAEELAKLGYQSEIWGPEPKDPIFKGDEFCKLITWHANDKQGFNKALNAANLYANECIIISHGCWREATMQALKLKKMGFKWVYVPQGMLEPWSMSQKKLKKQIYFALREKPAASKADVVRAVSRPEFGNLSKVFKNCVQIANGSETTSVDIKAKPVAPIQFLFMARLHHKKGIIPLVEAWIALGDETKNAVLKIAGLDDGELQYLQVLLSKLKPDNVHYLGGVYGVEKTKLLTDSSFYVLPTFSEGFPSSVVEACQYGCVILTTEGANFPEAMERGLILEITPEVESIKTGLLTALKMGSELREDLAEKTIAFVRENLSLEVIARQQDQVYRGLLT